VRPDLAGGMSRVGTDHRELARLGSTLRDEIEQVLAGQVIRRDAIVADLLRYINLLREHMRWEERDLFLRIEEMIRDGHTTLGSAKVVEVADPVFGQAVERHFARLLDTLRE
jgi:hemerythrin-like domain-containing protein